MTHDSIDASEVLPNFAALFEPHIDGDGWQMTPRMAMRLWHTALRLADEWQSAPLDRLVDDLPRIARPHAADGAWRQQFADAFRQIAGRLSTAEGLRQILAQCTADEVALHFTIDAAGSDVARGITPEHLDRLPDHGASDVDFGWMQEVLFEDHDVLMLYNPALDGIEIDFDSNDLLHPRDWFQPFR